MTSGANPRHGFARQAAEANKSSAIVPSEYRINFMRSDITVELTRARGSDNLESDKLVEKRAVAPHVQRFVGSPDVQCQLNSLNLLSAFGRKLLNVSPWLSADRKIGRIMSATMYCFDCA